MNGFNQIALREIRIGIRNPWAYSFMALFALFMLTLLLINAQGQVQGYSSVTATMVNLALYFLPLMTLMLGSFSLTGDKEDGSWELLSTYPLRTSAFIAGKFAGLAAVLTVIVCFGFGVAGVAGWAAGSGFDAGAFFVFLLFAVGMSVMFLAVSMVIGTLARNRWQALTVAVALWFFLVIAWAPVLIAVLGWMPYMWIKPAVTVLTLLNPAELARVFAVIHLGGGSVFGPEYYDWVKWARRPSGMWAFAAYPLIWTALLAGLAGWLWERGRTRV
jgi:Cu-processing system permease protein